ncbi:MAG: hypothetical protein JXN62_05000 [Bacteroidales bacterium]|nr:hypothetical protein [Bacteroidales bacterium]
MLTSFPVLEAKPYADDLTGTWKAEFDTPIGMQNYTYIIKQEGTKLTGKIIGIVEGQKNEGDLLEGKFEDGIITFVEIMDFMGEELRITYKGKPEGDEIKFTREVGEFATETLVAKRVVPETK